MSLTPVHFRPLRQGPPVVTPATLGQRIVYDPDSASRVSYEPKHYLDARDYGPLGTRDDTVTLQAALSAAGAMGGARVVLPNYTTPITGLLTIADHTWLTAGGSRSLIQWATGSAGAMIQNEHAIGQVFGGPHVFNTNIAVEGVALDGGPQAAQVPGALLNLAFVTGAYLESVTIRGGKTAGIHFRAVQRGHVLHCEVSETGAEGIDVATSSHVRVAHNYTENTAGDAMSTYAGLQSGVQYNSVGCSFIDNDVNGIAAGFGVTGHGLVIGLASTPGTTTDFVAALNRIRGTQGNGILCLQGAQNGSIVGNVFRDITSSCIAINGAASGAATEVLRNITVADNEGIGATGAAASGVLVSAGVVDVFDVRVRGNSFRTIGGLGLYFRAAGGKTLDHLIAEGNTISNANQVNPQTVSAVLLQVATGGVLSNARLAGNHFYDDQTPKTQKWGYNINNDGASTFTNVRVEDNNFLGSGSTADANVPSPAYAGVTYRNNLGLVSENRGVASKADGGTIAHGLKLTPATYGISSTAAGHIASITGVDGTNLTIALKLHDGTAIAVAENVAWWAEI